MLIVGAKIFFICKPVIFSLDFKNSIVNGGNNKDSVVVDMICDRGEQALCEQPLISATLDFKHVLRTRSSTLVITYSPSRRSQVETFFVYIMRKSEKNTQKVGVYEVFL